MSSTPPKFSNETLSKLHSTGFVLHLVQSAYCFYLTNTRFKDQGKFRIRNGSSLSAQYNLGNVVGVFPLLAAAQHLASVVFRKKYENNVASGYNPWRWGEYSLSAGLMFFVTAQLSGIQDIKLLGFLLGSNVALQYFGYRSEKSVAGGRGGEANEDVTAGFILFLAMWFPIMTSFFRAVSEADQAASDPESAGPPDIVYAIIFVMLTLFVVFGITSLAYVRGANTRTAPKWWKLEEKDFTSVEVGFLILSFITKSLLTNMTLFGAINRPSDDVPEEDVSE